MKTDFSECSFIEDEMQFYTYTDFCRSKEMIKKLYNSLSRDGKIFYKYYVYANTHMNLTYKNRIWDYLNGYDEDGLELMRASRWYKPL